MPRQFPPDFRQRALRLHEESLPEHETEYAAIHHVGSRLGVGPETLRKWRRRAAVDSGARRGVTTEEQSEMKRLKRENTKLRRANEILRTAAACFAAELDRPTTRRSDTWIRSRITSGSRPAAASFVRQSVGFSPRAGIVPRRPDRCLLWLYQIRCWVVRCCAFTPRITVFTESVKCVP